VPVEDDAGADALPDLDAQEAAVGVLTQAELGEGGGVGVVGDVHGGGELGGEAGSQVEAVPAEVGGLEHGAGRVDDAGAAHADAEERPVGGGGEIGGEGEGDLDGGGAGPAVALGGAPVEDLACEVDQGGPEALVVAEVEGDGEPGVGDYAEEGGWLADALVDAGAQLLDEALGQQLGGEVAGGDAGEVGHPGEVGPAERALPEHGPEDEGAVVAAGVSGARLAPGALLAGEGLVVGGAVGHICLSNLQTNGVSRVTSVTMSVATCVTTSPPSEGHTLFVATPPARVTWSRHPLATPYVASTMKGWAAAIALFAVIAAAALGLWATWDDTQPAATDPLPAGDLVTTTTSRIRAGDPTTTVPPAPECTVGSEPVDGDPAADWSTVVVDTGHSLPPDFAPTDLVGVAEAGFATHDLVRTFVIPDLAALRAAAEANGTPMVVVSGYRSYDYQRTLFTRRAADVGEEQAALETARPGHSEHQLGTAVDVLDPGSSDLTTTFADTPLSGWLTAHAHEYGFVISYPEGARARTCYGYEPWHLRYVGSEVATSISNSGVTAREWLLGSRAGAAGGSG
jgi:D-alanyl-D-alanine carboxypeptidase